jgi:hypothetical protein
MGNPWGLDVIGATRSSLRSLRDLGIHRGGWSPAGEGWKSSCEANGCIGEDIARSALQRRNILYPPTKWELIGRLWRFCVAIVGREGVHVGEIGWRLRVS